MKIGGALALWLAATSLAQAQVTVPLGSITINPPPPTSFTQQVTQSVDVTVTFNGLQYRGTGSLTGNLTFTVVNPSGGGTSGSTSAITRITDASGTVVTTGAAGGILLVVGTGLGSFGTATVAGLPAVVISWTATQVTLKIPTAGSATGTASGPVVLKPGDAAPATSTTTVTLTGLTAELPPSTDPTWESPVIATSSTSEQDPPPSLDELYGLLPVVPEPLPAPEFRPSAIVYAANMADGKMTISGQAFGAQGSGHVEVNDRQVPVLSWSNEEIVVLLISLDIVPADNASVLVWHGLDDYYYGTVALNGAELG